MKGNHLVIKAAKKLLDGGYDAELWIVGDGYYKNSLIRLAERLNIRNNVKFLGAKNHKELAEIYNQSSVFVLANFQEITPAVNEALACEIPVVIMDCGGVDFVIKSKDCGIITKKFDVDDMAKGIKAVLDNKAYAKRMAQNGRKCIVNNFSIEKVAEKFYKCFTG